MHRPLTMFLLVPCLFAFAACANPRRGGDATALRGDASAADALLAIRQEFKALPRPLVLWYAHDPGHWERRMPWAADGFTTPQTRLTIALPLRNFLAGHSSLEIACALWPLLQDDNYARDVAAVTAILTEPSGTEHDPTYSADYLYESGYHQNDPARAWKNVAVAVHGRGTELQTVTGADVVARARYDLEVQVWRGVYQQADPHIRPQHRPADLPTLDSRLCALAFSVFGPDDYGVHASEDEPLLPTPDRMARLDAFDRRLVISLLAPLIQAQDRTGRIAGTLLTSMLQVAPATAPSSYVPADDLHRQRRDQIARAASDYLRALH